jgi:hypothetical protein
MMLPVFLRWEAVGLFVLYRIWAVSFRANFSSRAAASAMSFATSSLRSTGIVLGRPRFRTFFVMPESTGDWSASNAGFDLSGGESGGRLLLSKATWGAHTMALREPAPHTPSCG